MTLKPFALNVLLVDFGAEEVIIIVQEALDEVHEAHYRIAGIWGGKISVVFVVSLSQPRNFYPQSSTA